MVQDVISEKRPSKDAKFVKEVMKVAAPKKEEHEIKICELIETEKLPASNHWRAGRLTHSHFDWNTSRIALVDNKIAKAFGVYDITMRIGTARVRVAGENLEYTAASYRDEESWHDLAEKVGKAAVNAMRDQGYDLAIAFGGEHYWSRLGFVFAWRELEWYVDAKELPPESPDFEYHEFEPVHRDDLGKLYNHENETLTGTAVRPTYLRNKHPNHFQGWYWTDSQGNPIGYISGMGGPSCTMDVEFQKDLDKGILTERIRQVMFERYEELDPRAFCEIVKEGHRWIIVNVDWRGLRKYSVVKDSDKLNVYWGERSRFWVDESAGNPEQILRVLGILTRQAGCDEVTFDRLHYKSALGRRLRQMFSCRIDVRNRSYMVRIINLQSLFEKLAPELSRRLHTSHLADWSGNLLIFNGEEEVMLAIHRSDVRVVPAGRSDHAIRGGMEIVQLVVGTETPDEVVEMNDMQLSGDAKHLIRVLFPAQYPQMENQGL